MSRATSSGIAFSNVGSRLRPPAITALMQAALEDHEVLSLAAGFTDSSSLPVDAVGRAIRRLEQKPGPPEHLQYGTNQGRPGLRRLLAEFVGDHDRSNVGSIDPESVLITNGSQQALYLASRVLCEPGDIVLVERPSYFVYLDMLKGLGVDIRTLPEKTDGSIDPNGLELLLDQCRREGSAGRIKIVYIEGYFSNPTGRSRSENEKRDIARTLTASTANPVVIEDAAYRDLYFRDPYPGDSILALSEFESIPCLYLGTLTKPYATGLKVGFGICSHPEWLQRILWLKSHQDFGTANFNQAILEEVVLDGGLDEQTAKLRKNYLGKMEALHAALIAEDLGSMGWKWTKPLGGLYLWLQAPRGLDTRMDSDFWQACREEHVLYIPGDLCYGNDAPADRVRLSFGVLEPDDLARAAARFARASRRIVVPA
jgi:2-aminoadipate transaminase